MHAYIYIVVMFSNSMKQTLTFKQRMMDSEPDSSQEEKLLKLQQTTKQDNSRGVERAKSLMAWGDKKINSNLKELQGRTDK